jgi:hypothetical protein
MGEETVVHPPSQAGFARSQDPMGGLPGPFGGSPLASAPTQASPGGTAGRRLPTSGIRPRPRGRGFDGVVYARRPRRIIGIMIVLLLIGIGVALGVAFSGPELEVVDPTVGPSPAQAAPTNPPAATPGTASPSPSVAGTPGTNAPVGGTPTAPVGAAPAAPVGAASAGSGAATRQPPPPSELPGPPPATQGPL